MGFNIAVDGPAGAGKSTIAKLVAKRMNLIYVDTGAMYRAMALYFIKQGVDIDDVEAVASACTGADITIKYEDGVQVVYLNGENVSPYLRTEEVGNAASVTSGVARVRARLLELQQTLAKNSDCIMDGRDIGTCILPNADVKIYLTASSAVRAKRRFDELVAKGEECDLATIQADIEERDYRDMHREVAPLKQAEDAVLVDSSYMTIEEVVERIVEIAAEKSKCEK